jgi:hypothetical protein
VAGAKAHLPGAGLTDDDELAGVAVLLAAAVLAAGRIFGGGGSPGVAGDDGRVQRAAARTGDLVGEYIDGLAPVDLHCDTSLYCSVLE